VLTAASSLYDRFRLRRIYYSAFSPIPDSSLLLPSRPAPLIRENRLYQADWLMRYYGFSSLEITDGLDEGMLDPAIDPKLAWALRNRDRFPVDVNVADREMLLRVPGLGRRTVDNLLQARNDRPLRLEDIKRLAGSLRRVRPFVVTADHRPTKLLDRAALRGMVAPRQQLSLFG
jgi:predicted DNA-binding helix-hairpin-helix protein